MTTYTQEQLTEARLALHQRSLGLQVVSVKYDGREVDYNQVSLTDLDMYVDRIERAIGGASAPRRTTFVAGRGFR